MLNIDWFQPFSGCVYSVGVLYLAIMNLPRSHRYKRQNILILGIIPGPSEPPLTINSYLSPLVSELLQLWQWVLMKVDGCGEKVIRAALLAVACDLPAGQKVCGFLSHSAGVPIVTAHFLQVDCNVITHVVIESHGAVTNINKMWQKSV